MSGPLWGIPYRIRHFGATFPGRERSVTGAGDRSMPNTSFDAIVPFQLLETGTAVTRISVPGSDLEGAVRGGHHPPLLCAGVHPQVADGCNTTIGGDAH